MQYNITNASKVAHTHAPSNALQTNSVSVYRLVIRCATKNYFTFPDSTSMIAQVSPGDSGNDIETLNKLSSERRHFLLLLDVGSTETTFSAAGDTRSTETSQILKSNES